MRKLIITVLAVFCIAIATPAIGMQSDGGPDCCGNSYLEQGQFGVNALLTGIEISPLSISEIEECCCTSEFGLNWGGLNVDMIAIQAIGQRQGMGTMGSASVGGIQCSSNKIELHTDTMDLLMKQKSFQTGHSSSSGCCGMIFLDVVP